MKKFIIFGGIFLLIAAAVLAFIELNSNPDVLSKEDKEKAIGEILGRKANLNPNTEAGNLLYEGKYVVFEYPARAKLYDYKGSLANNSESETFSFDLENPRLVFNYLAEQRNDLKTLDDIPSVVMRNNPTNGYKQSKLEADGVEGIAFMKSGSSEYRGDKSGYFLVNGKSYSFSVSGADMVELSRFFDEIVASVKFTN